ncbi:unnamed protein product [Clavelina lepadiformis]|uniref:Uncharacterized protein n=1 Tax=Clavelina lepadiformis TaxID=159417 RepID=A0ABP0GYD7_CLALP
MGKVEYKISIKTSSAYTGASTNATVNINLISKDGNASTGYFKLDNFWKNDFEKGKVDKFKKKTKDVGLPEVIGIKLTGGMSGKDAWFCDYIEIDVGGSNAFYPVYDWVEDEIQVTHSSASIPQKSSDYVRQMRQAEVEQHKHDYDWIPKPTPDDLGWNLPRSLNAATYDELPPIFKRPDYRDDHLNQKKSERKLDALVSFVKSKVFPVKTLDDFQKLNRREFTDRQSTNYTDGWDTDEGMGRQVLTGINPLGFYQCHELPKKFNVTNADVAATLGPSTSLDKEMKAGKCYVFDARKKLAPVERNFYFDTDKPLYCPNAIGLFHVNSKGNFLPIAIQLVPGNRDYLFTPSDTKDDWLLAKLYFRTAECSLHEWDAHLFSTHVFMEPFSIATFRCFPRCHPVYKLLRPHLQTVMAINTEGRPTLIAPGSPANKAIATMSASALRCFFKDMTLDELNIVKRLKAQGLDNPKLLPNFHYRDDATLLWDIMKNYVSKVIRHYYKSDVDVRNDYELQDYVKDVANNGLGWQDGNTHGMPDKITTIEQLVDLCHALMFTSSVQHAAVNFGQYETYRFIPNCPSAMRLPPHKKGEATMERIMNSLPDEKVALAAIALAYTLSSFSPDESYLGDYPERYFTDQAVLRFREEYRSELREAGEKMRKRNEGLQHPYTWLYPDRVPNSIAI